MAASAVGGLGLVWPPQLPTPSLLPPKAFPEETRPEGRAAMRHLPERVGRRREDQTPAYRKEKEGQWRGLSRGFRVWSQSGRGAGR